ncbi:hypothetical protein ABPG75_013750 [Micractinium tetrahymenae]
MSGALLAMAATGRGWRLAAAALLLALLAAAAAGVDATKCGRNAGGKRCPDPKDCCSIYGFCGTGSRFCAVGKCDSGACYGRPQPPPARPQGCTGVCGITVRQGATARPTCRQGMVVVGIPTAVYGAAAKKCISPMSRRIAWRRCVGRPFCTIPATNEQFGGDPCPRVQRKTLWVRYFCKASTPRPQPIPRPSPSPRPDPSPQPDPSPAPGNAYYSTLWGRSGEYWRPTSQLADYAWAGYMGNERDIPTFPVRFDVKKFGAKGDGETDDTQAIQAALNAAGEAAELLNTYDCSTRYTRRRCDKPSDGWGNQGRAGVAVWLPPGSYCVTQALTITWSNVVLRGAGQDKTRLYFPKGLQAVYGRKEVWGTSGGFIVIDGNNAGSNQDRNLLARVTADVRKGDRRLQVSTTDGIEVGQWVRLYALASSHARRRLQSATAPGDPRTAAPPPPAGASRNATATPPQAPPASGSEEGVLPLPPALARLVAEGIQAAESEQVGVSVAAQPGSIDAFIYGENLVDSGRNAFSGSDHLRFPSRVTKVGQGYIELERPVPWDLRTEWQPVVHKFASTTQHSGVERLTIQFRHDVYPAHLNTYGYNAIVMHSASNCWVRGVDIIDADNGVQVAQADFVTIANIRIWVTASRSTSATAPDNGHHALWVSRSGDVAFTNFDIQDQYMHDLSVDGFSERCVFARGRGANLNIDCHRGGPHSHLFSDLDHGWGARPFRSGGDSSRGAHSGSNNTFWNLQASRPGPHLLDLPECDFGPLLNFVGQYNAPDGSGSSGGGSRRRSLLANSILVPGEGSTAAQGGSADDSSTADSPSPAPVPGLSSGSELVASAQGTYPAWCTATKWRTELVEQGQRLLPADLYSAMVATGVQRKVKRG